MNLPRTRAEATILTPARRVASVDILRSLALLAMIVFHVTFDLELFGYLAPGTTSGPGPWRSLAVTTAGSFLFLAGMSLWMAHGQGICWLAFWKRFGKVAGAAMLVSIGTYLVFPDAFVFFGILHSIALCSLFGLAVLRLPWAVLLGFAALAFFVPDFARSDAFNAPWFWWTGLQTVPLRTVDYEPIFPWCAPFLAGLVTAKLVDAVGLWSRRSIQASPAWVIRWLSWPGRHSLIIYLVHQPILLGLLWVVVNFGP